MRLVWIFFLICEGLPDPEECLGKKKSVYILLVLLSIGRVKQGPTYPLMLDFFFLPLCTQ